MASVMQASPTRVETLLPLTPDEARRLKQCEKIIERGLATFFEVGNALAEIRESRLYRLSYASFEDYCRERWQMSRFYAHRLIDAAQVVENLLPIVNLPTNEAQARELARLEPQLQKAAWHVVLKSAPTDDDGNPMVTAGHIRSVANVLTEVVKAGGMDDGSGEMKPLGVLIDAAVTEETYERLQQQKQYIRDHAGATLADDEEEDAARKPRNRGERSEVEVLYDPEIQERLTRYMKMITEFEEMDWPPELSYLTRMFQAHKAHAHFQKTRTREDDCEAALDLLKRLAPDPSLGFEIAAQEVYDWLFDLGYCMSKKQYTERMKYLSQDDQRKALWADAGENAKQEGRRGKLPGIIVLPWRKVWQSSKRICEQCESAFEPVGQTKICEECREDARSR